MKMSGGRAVAEMVALYEPGPIFGMGGFQMLPFYEGARALGLRHVLVNDERTGAFAAVAYAAATRRPGLCDGTLGPGATNLTTALVEAYNAGIPVVAFVGEQDRTHAWKNMTQETRQREILTPIVKEYIRVEEIDRVPELVRRAFSTATSGRPGPVALAVPEDIAHAQWDFSPADLWAELRAVRAPALRGRPDGRAVADAADVLRAAEQPVILAGGGVHLSAAYDEVRELARTLNAPVAHTLTGKGALACRDPYCIGLFGRYSRYANDVIDQADALVVIGCKLGEIATKRYTLPRQDVPLIHLDVLPEEVGRWSATAVGLWGDAGEGARDLAERLSDREPPARTEFWSSIADLRSAWEAEAAPKYASDDAPVHMARLIAELNDIMPADSVLTADGGFASHWAGLLYDTKKAGRTFITDRGFASIGYGIPSAMGSRFGRPDEPVVAITGDAGFNMSVGDLETARREGLRFVLVVVNNAASGYVKALQHSLYGAGNYESSDLSDMDYSKVAQAYGCHGIRVDSPDQLRGALLEGLAEKARPVVIDVVVTRDPEQMLPAVDNRILKVEAGDRPI